MKAADLLLTASEVGTALGEHAEVRLSTARTAVQALGDVVKTAAQDFSYRAFTGGVLIGGVERPLAAGQVVLLFDRTDKADRTFTQVADAAHLRTQLDGCSVAVETVTAPSGLVSYWGYLQRGPAIVVVTLDTLDPQHVSVADLRSLVAATASKLQEVAA